ncbi:hypothetical protein C8J57DRAFT_1578387 [Mycena rebaudengoi]|nr:hypothetical protein C8J57DRAFT_1578387 [Mycena rebaudengoi]
MISANATSIADFRNTKRNRLAEVKAKIYALKSSLELEEEYEEVQGILDTFFCPISAVPDDVLSRILIHCLPEDGRVRPSQRAAPLNLVRISKHWSTVALSTSELWCSVDLSFTSSWGDYGRKDVPCDNVATALETWFGRSKSRHLSITLRCDQGRHTFPPGVLPAIGRFCLQWRRLEMAVPSHDLPDFQSICGPFPLLHSCSIHVSDFHAALGTPYNLSALRDAPQLRELFLGRGVSIKDVPAELQHLTTLEIHDPAGIVFLECADLLRSFPHLIRFSSSIANRWYPINPLDPPASLQTLCLNYDDAFLAHVTIPGLQCFEYRVYESDNSTTVPTFLSFISRSRCVLQHLVLCATPPHTYWIDLSENSLMQCLHAVPSLTTLRFTAAVTAQRFYRELAAGTLLPNLQELYMCEKPEETYDYVPMTHMLTARQGSCAPAIPLDLFELDLARQPPKSELERTRLDTTFNIMGNVNPVREYPAVQRQLQALIRGGLSLRIKYPGETTWPSTECAWRFGEYAGGLHPMW